MKMKMKYKFDFKFLTFLLAFTAFMLFVHGCTKEKSEVQSATIKHPTLAVNPSGGPQSSKHGGTATNKDLDITVNLPLVLFPSFEYRMITRGGGFSTIAPGRDEFCIINESEASQLEIDTKIEVIEEARCLYVRLNSSEGIPRSYATGIMKIRLIETGEEGWTWSKAVEFD